MSRRALLALALCALAVAGSWMVPGLVGKGWGALVPQEQAATSTDTAPSGFVTPEPSTGTSLGDRLTGLVGLAAIIGIGFALSRDRGWCREWSDGDGERWCHSSRRHRRIPGHR